MVFVLLSPAKTLAFDNTRVHLPRLIPHFQKQAIQLVKLLRDYSTHELQKLMGISPKLAALNRQRFADFTSKPQNNTHDAAILAYRGDVYQGFAADSCDDDDLLWAHDHLGLLSGLYGVLQPLELIEPYRLEMGIKLASGKASNLYEFWGDQITNRINALVHKNRLKAVIGCASQEYLASVRLDTLDVPFIQCDFKENKNGKPQIVALFAKRARGMMARYVVANRITDPKDLKSFDSAGYRFKASLSEPDHLVFVR